MNDDEWEERRKRAILAAFQTGRSIFADTDGEMRYADGAKEPLADGVGLAVQPIPRATTLAVRAQRASRFAFVASGIAAVANAVAAIWNPWQITAAVVFAGCAVIWHRVNRQQRAMLKGVTK